MLRVLEGPLIIQPEIWTLVFDRKASTWWASWLAFGRYKHVRAYAYVPFLHVWVFVDPHLSGTEIIVAADGAPAQAVMQTWIVSADLIRVRRRPGWRRVPFNPFCVGAIKRLVGIRSCALRVDALFKECLRHGELFGGDHASNQPASGRPCEGAVSLRQGNG